MGRLSEDSRTSEGQPVRNRGCLDLQKAQNYGPYTACTLYFGILGRHSFGFGPLGCPGEQRLRSYVGRLSYLHNIRMIRPGNPLPDLCKGPIAQTKKELPKSVITITALRVLGVSIARPGVLPCTRRGCTMLPRRPQRYEATTPDAPPHPTKPRHTPPHPSTLLYMGLSSDSC